MVRQLKIDWEGSGCLDGEIFFRFLADRLGIGSVQDSQKAECEGEDEAFLGVGHCEHQEPASYHIRSWLALLASITYSISVIFSSL
jgi:hypothetical protein